MKVHPDIAELFSQSNINIEGDDGEVAEVKDILTVLTEGLYCSSSYRVLGIRTVNTNGKVVVHGDPDFQAEIEPIVISMPNTDLKPQ